MTAVLLAILCFQTGHITLAILAIVVAVITIVVRMAKELE